jgi:hypothetical protein
MRRIVIIGICLFLFAVIGSGSAYAQDIAGRWRAEFSNHYVGTWRLHQTGDEITGRITVGDNSRRDISGRKTGSSVSLTRDTGLKTIQHYQLSIESPDRIRGTYWNTGRDKDKGTLTLTRIR